MSPLAPMGLLYILLLAAAEPAKVEPTHAAEAAAQKAAQDASVDAKYFALVAKLSPAEQAWEKVLQDNLGNGFYLPAHKRDKIAGKSTAWDYVADDPKLPRVLLIGDSVSRGYTLPTRQALAGVAHVHRAPANCGPTAAGVKNLDVWLGTGKWDVIHFNFGIHDRGVPLKDYSARLDQIAERLQRTGAKVIWASTTPIPDMPAQKQTAVSIIERNALALGIMQRRQIPVDDLFTAITPRLQELQNPNDVHFNAAGYDFLGAQVAAAIRTALPATAAK